MSEIAKTEHILCAPFCFAAISALSMVDLAKLESSSRRLREVMHSSIWASAACSLSRLSHVSLPYDSLAAMPVPKLKIAIRNMLSLQPSLASKAVELYDSVELNSVSHICSQASMHEDVANVVIGRLYFDEEDLLAIKEGEEGADGAELFCFSSEIVFSLPDRAGVLSATLGCRRDDNILEVSSVNRSSMQEKMADVSLSFDLHLVSSAWNGACSEAGLSIPSTGGCTKFVSPGFDVTQEQSRRVLASPDGVLCILVVRRCKNGRAQLASFPQSMNGAISWQFKPTSPSLNALALEVPTSMHSPVPVIRRAV
jgi:hypothetical protein